jgi:hypothetical protein
VDWPDCGTRAKSFFNEEFLIQLWTSLFRIILTIKIHKKEWFEEIFEPFLRAVHMKEQKDICLLF